MQDDAMQSIHKIDFRSIQKTLYHRGMYKCLTRAGGITHRFQSMLQRGDLDHVPEVFYIQAMPTHFALVWKQDLTAIAGEEEKLKTDSERDSRTDEERDTDLAKLRADSLLTQRTQFSTCAEWLELLDAIVPQPVCNHCRAVRDWSIVGVEHFLCHEVCDHVF